MNSFRGSFNNRSVARHFLQRLQSSSLRNASTAASNVSQASANEPEIDIPFRKERGSTDILFALEKTISRDPTAPHYKYIDDPYMSPISNRGKRVYALAKEAGRKAAKWIHAEHAELFTQRLAEPEIQAFLPKAKYEKKEDVSEKLLMTVINEAAVTDALTIYKLLENEVSLECKQALLELLCYHNSEEQLPDDLVEERWYRKAASRQRQIWKSNPEVEALFEFLKKQEKAVAARAYNAMICGTAKFMKVDKAWALYEECKKKDLPLAITTYNNLIQLVSVLRDGPTERKTLLFELFADIERSGLSPNVATLNAALKVTSTFSGQHIAKDFARLLFTEFKSIGVEPSLASYYYALIIFCNEHGPTSGILREIMNELEGKTFTVQDLNDTFFFVTAMDVARNHLNDYPLAERIHELLLTGDNYNFIGEGFKESIYYRHYMVLLLRSVDFEKFMNWYDTMVPNVYIPEPSVMEELIDKLETIEPTFGRDVMTRLWSHMVMFEHLDRNNLMKKALQIMRINFCPPKESPINAQYAEAAWTYWTHVQEQSEQRLNRTAWNGKVLADVAILLLRGGQFDRFLKILHLMVNQQDSIIGTMDAEQLEIIFQACFDYDHPVALLDILKYSVEAGFEESYAMGEKIRAHIPLTAEQDLLMTNLIGKGRPENLGTEESRDKIVG